MQMEFKKIPIPYLQKVAGQLRSQEETMEVRLPDGMPDIGRVLGAWGQVIVRGKEWNGSDMSVSCGVMVWVLYTPEDGEGVRSVDVWLPLSMAWEIPDTGNDGKINVSCLLQGVDARSISARKMMVRATLVAQGEGWLPGEAQIAEPEELPDDIAVLSADYPILLPREAGEKAFLLEDERSIMQSNSKPEKLLYYSLQPQIYEKKIMAGKLVFRGAGIVHVLCQGEEGSLFTCDYELPFSQYADLEGSYDQEAVISMIPCITSLDISLGDNGQLQLKAGILGQYLLHERTMVTVTEDAYSPHRKVKTEMEMLCIPAVLDQTAQTIREEVSSDKEIQRVLDVVFYPEMPQLVKKDDGIVLPLTGRFQMLYYDPNGDIRSSCVGWEGQSNLTMDEGSIVSAWIDTVGKPQQMQVGGSVTLRGEVTVAMRTIAGQGIPMVSKLEMEEEVNPDKNRPSLILARKGNCRLWDVAKRTGSTVEAIMSANGLGEEPEDSRVLLIPVL